MNSRPRRPNPMRRSNRAQVQAVHKAMNGIHLNPVRDPPKITVRPWNSLVVVVDNPVSPYTTQNLRDAFQAQLLDGPVLDQLLFEYQIEDVRVWGPTSVGQSESDRLNVKFLDTIGTDALVLSDQDDRPATNARAVLGYRWPESQQRNVLRAGPSGGSIPPRDLFSHDGGVLAYIHVRWRLAGLNTPPLDPSPQAESSDGPSPPGLGTRVRV